MTTQMSLSRLFKALMFSWFAVAAVEAVSAQERTLPLDRTFLINQCPTDQGGERDRCLASLALANEDPSFCAADPESGCLELAGRAGVEQCGASLSGEDRYMCELGIITSYPAPEACAQTLEPDNCISIVAAERGDPAIITDRFAPGEQRDRQLALYAMTAGDRVAAEMIDDPFLHDMAIAASAGTVSSLEEGIDPDHCNGMRGNYGPDHDDLDPQSVAGLCNGMVSMLNQLSSQLSTIEGEDNRDQFVMDAMRELAQLADGLESGDIDIDTIFPELADDFESGFDDWDPEQAALIQQEIADTAAANVPEPAPAMSGCSAKAWAGKWCSNYGEMNLIADEHGFVGSYTWDNGRIEGTLDPSTCTAWGEWFEDPNSSPNDWGHFAFTLDPQADSWSGKWGYNTGSIGSNWRASRC